MRFQKYPDTCGRGLSQWFSLQRKILWNREFLLTSKTLSLSGRGLSLTANFMEDILCNCSQKYPADKKLIIKKLSYPIEE